MVIRVITAEALESYNEDCETNYSVDELSDKAFKEICNDYGGWEFGSIGEFVSEFNADGNLAPMPSEHYLRAFRK